MNEVRYLGVMELAARLGVCRMTANKLIRKGEIVAVRPGRNWKVAESEVSRFEQSARYARSRQQQIWNANGLSRAATAATAATAR